MGCVIIQIIVTTTSSLAQTAAPALKLASFLLEDGRILHGYGMDMFRWHTDAVPYIEASANKPALYGSYIRFTDVRSRDQDRLEQLTRLHKGWSDPDSGIQAPIVPMIGLQAWSYDFQERRDTLAAAFFDILGISPQAMQQFGLERAVYDMSLFATFLQHPSLWSCVQDTLVGRGLDPRDIDLPALMAEQTEEAEYRLISLRDSALVLAADRLIDAGFQFQDLAVLDGAFDDEIREIADSVRSVPSPYLVRFMYETIDGVSRPVLYSSETFKAALRHLVELFREQGATNAEFIYHPNAGNAFNLAAWYPGDSWTDWVSPSIFHSLTSPAQWDIMEDQHDFAALRNLPVIIAESGPTNQKYRPHNTSYPGVWEDWFQPYFAFMRQSTHARAFVYIGVDWGRLDGNFSHWGDTRVIVNPDLFARWEAELSDPLYLHNEEFWSTWTSLTTGIESPPTGQTLSVWPNPSSGNVSIRWGDTRHGATLSVYNLLGQRIHSTRMPHGTHTLTWDGTTHAGEIVRPGVYLIRLDDGLDVITRTIVRN